MTAYNIQSQVVDTGGVNLVIDIRGAGNEPIAKGRGLDAWQPTGRQNQLWTLVPAGSGWFTIQSNLTGVDSGEFLVIDIQGAGNAPVKLPAELDVFTPTGLVCNPEQTHGSGDRRAACHRHHGGEQQAGHAPAGLDAEQWPKPALAAGLG
jgi:hypothetical protein